MQQFTVETDRAERAQRCAAALVEVVPMLMRAVRHEMRSTQNELSVPQFRALGFIAHHPGTTLSGLAERLGLNLPTASKLVDSLVERELVVRESPKGDRRKVALTLTDAGLNLLAASREAALSQLSRRLAGLSEEELDTVLGAMHALAPLFDRCGHSRPESWRRDDD